MTDNPAVPSVSRRDFARHVAVAATALALPEVALAQTTPSPQSVSSQPEIPKEIAAEVEAKFGAVIKLTAPGVAGAFTAEQKDEIRRQLISQVQGLQKLRAYPLENANAPDLVLRMDPSSIELPVFIEITSGPDLATPEKK